MAYFIRQKIINHTYKIGVIKQINIKNQTYDFYNDIIDLKHFMSNLLKNDKKLYKDIGIYNIGYITIKKIDDCKNINTVNPLYLHITHASWYIKVINGNKYLIFHSTDEKKELLKKYNDIFNGIRDEIKTINGGKENDYKKDYMKTLYELNTCV